MRPVIGITTYVESASWGVWRDTPAALSPYGYVTAVRSAGGRAVLLPPDDLDTDVLDRLDGLLLGGGADVEPHRYGATPDPRTVARPDRDAAELALLRAALERDLPVLGVCRGLQLLAVVAGGALHQHLPDVLGHENHQPGPALYGRTAVRLAPGSRVAGLLGAGATVSCYHHQGIADPGALAVTGRADDGLPEAAEWRDRRFVLGVQWHPELDRDTPLAAGLVAAARGDG